MYQIIVTGPGMKVDRWNFEISLLKQNSVLIKHISCGLQSDQPKQETGKGHSRVFNTKAYATETNRSPVKTFKTFVSHR